MAFVSECQSIRMDNENSILPAKSNARRGEGAGDGEEGDGGGQHSTKMVRKKKNEESKIPNGIEFTNFICFLFTLGYGF